MLEKISEHCWGLSEELRLGPGTYFPTRMTVIEASPGELAVVAPIDFDEEAEAAIRELGEVRWIIAPNNFHHMFVGKAAKIFPEAAVYGAPGAVKKQPGVEFAGSLSDVRPAGLPDSVVLFNIAGTPMLDETVLWLPDDRALLTTDLVFNMHRPKTWWTKFMLKMVVGSGKEPRQSRSIRYLFMKDRQAYSESLSDLAARDFDVLVMSHGDVVREAGGEAFRAAIEWAVPQVAKELTA